MVDYVVGVDGGTTKTIALVADLEGRIVGAARGTGSNWYGENVEIPMTTVVNTVRAAVSGAGIGHTDISVGAMALAGADWPDDYTRRYDYLTDQSLAQRIIVKNDAMAGLRAGSSQPYGIGLAVGTGANCAIITPDGQEWAYGYYVDSGGANDMAREAMRAVFHEEDGRGEPTALTPHALQRLQVPTVEALMRARVAQRIDHGRQLSLCPLVFELAAAGDSVSQEILRQQGRALAEYVTTLVRRYGLQSVDIELVLSGSVFKGVCPLLVDTLTSAVHREAPQVRIVRARHEPAVGSLLLAYDALGVPVTEKMHQQLKETMPATELFDTADGGDWRNGRRMR